MGLRIEVTKQDFHTIHIKTEREAHLSLASRFKAPENAYYSRNEQLRTSRRYVNQSLYTRYAYRADTP